MNEHEDPRDELEDRWTDQALAEVVGGKRPPDLTARILAAARQRRFALRPRMKLALAASLLAMLAGIGGFVTAVYTTHRNWTAAVDRDVDFTGGVSVDADFDNQTFDQGRASAPRRRNPDDAVAKPEWETKTKSHPFPRKQYFGSRNPSSEIEPRKLIPHPGRTMHSERSRAIGVNTRMKGHTIEGKEVLSTRVYPVADLVVRTSEEPPIVYPDSEVWQALTERRKKYKAVNLSEGSSAEARLRSALWDKTELDFTDQPLSDVMEYLKAKHDIEIQLDNKALTDAGVGGDTTITRNLKGITLRSALRTLLSEIDLTYVIKDEVLLITTKGEAQNIVQYLADDGHGPGEGGDRYARIIENPFLDVTDNPLSTFSIDVDTASYAKTRRFIEQESCLPPPDAVRIEEFVNYFSYDYAPPEGNVPFSAHVEVAACPWQPEHRLLRIGLKGKEIPRDDRPAANLVFLLDVSGSMQPEDKLPRVRRAMHLLAEQLREQDRVAMVVYAAASGLVLPSTSGFQQEKIAAALDALEAGGSTNGGDGIRLAYDTAQASFIKGGTNRVVLCTDGDFNVGTTSTAELERLIEERAKGGVFLTVLGFGMGNHNDEMMEKLADKGNGNYGYVDSEQEARKLLVEQAGGTLVTIAKDVKLQLEFNPLAVGAYRLIGYEDRMLRAEDFNDDKKDAGEIGAGHTVTALYELVPPGKPVETPAIDELKYQRPAAPTEAAASGELLTLKLRYKDPDGEASHEPLVIAARDDGHGFAQATADFKFASAVAGFGLLLRGSEFKGNLTYAAVLELAGEGLGPDPNGHRAAFVELVKKAISLTEE